MAQKVGFGLTLPNRGVVLGITTVKDTSELSVETEKSGVFDSVWAGDSIAAKPRLEAITLLSTVAARTERVTLGPACFASFPLRHPTCSPKRRPQSRVPRGKRISRRLLHDRL